jgi:hypothetical protein
MSDTQSQTPQHRTIVLQQPAAEDSLLICCKNSDGSSEAASTGPDSSSKTIGLELLSPTDKTCAREICC